MTDFPDIVLSAGKSKKRGQVSLSGSSPSDCKIVFSPKSKPIEILLSSIEALHWVEVGATLGEGSFVLKLSPKSGNFLKFSGFQAAAYGAINAWCSAGGKELEIEKVSTRGANWGKLIVDNHRMKFEDKDSFLVWDMPVQAVSQTVVQGKSEIGIEFPQDDDPKSLASQMETLCEIRIFVPNDEREKELAAKEKEREAAAAARELALANGEEVPPVVKTEGGEDGDDVDGDDDGGEEAETAAQLMVKDLQSRTGANDAAIQPIARFQLMFQSPRGKYSVDLFPAYLKLHSKTFQYKILYKFIQKMFLFANPGTQQHYFVIGLNPPVRQGRTAYPYLLVQFDDKEEMEEQFNIDAETCATKYKDLMEPTMRGPAHEVVTRVFKALTERKVLTPGPQFQSKLGGACIRCNLKAQDGYLYVLEKSFFFVKKPLLHLRHTDITEVMFRRVNSSAAAKSFDVHIITNEEKNNEYIFSSIQKDEYQGLFDFLRTRKLTISSDATHGSLTTGASGRMRVAANYDEETDQHLNNINAELGGEDDDSEDDEDFEGKSSSSSSESGSDVAEEASDSDEAPVQKRKSKGKSHGSDDDSDGGKKKKKKEGGTKRKRGADKEDAGPKRPQAKSAYFHYLAEARPKYVAEHPEIKSNMIAVTGALAQQWKELDPATRAVYQKMSDDEKARLAAENPEVEAAPKAPRKRASKKGGPTKPPSAQVLFLSETKAAKKAANPGLSAPELAALQREEWKSMGEEAQQTWKEKVLVLAKRYKIEKAEWDEKHPAADEDGDDEADGAAGADDDAPMAASSSAASSSDKGKKERKKKKKEKKEKKEKKNKKDKKKKKKDDAGSDASDDDMADEPQVKEEMDE